MYTTNAVASPVLDRDAWLTQHQLIWGEHADELPGARLSFTSNSDSGWKVLGTTPVDDPMAGWELVRPVAERGASIFVGVAPRKPGTTGQGGKEDILCHTALVADLDVSSGAHASGNNPTLEQALAWVAELPFEPSLVIQSGGGLHVWQGLYDPIDAADAADGQAIFEGWAAFWRGLAERDNLNVDDGPLANRSLVLRVAGTRNHKYEDATVHILSQSGYLLHLDDAKAMFPAPVAPERPLRTGRTDAAPASLSERAGDRFAFAVPAAEFLIQALGAKPAGSGSLTIPREDGTYSGDRHASISPAKGLFAERVTLFADSRKVTLGIDDGVQSFTSFEWLAVLLGGSQANADFKAAARLLAATERENTWGDELFDRLASVRSGAALDITPVTKVGASVAESAAPTGVVSGIPLDADGKLDLNAAMAIKDEVPAVAVPASASVVDAIETGQITDFHLDNDVIVAINGPHHGIRIMVWKMDKEGKSYQKAVQVTNWVAWRREVESANSVDGAGDAYEVNATYLVEIIRADGRRKSRDGFTADTSVDPNKVVNSIDFGVDLPLSTVNRSRVGTMLKQLGYEERTNVRAFGAAGWLRDDQRAGKHVFLAPAGSITADGPAPEYTVTAPPGSQAGALTPAGVAMGYPEVPQSQQGIEAAAAAIPAFMAILPTRPEAAAALLGITFAAPLALSNRCTVFLTADPGYAKSKLMGVTQGFVSGIANGSEFTGGAILRDTVAAVQVKSSWGRHSLLCWDDFKHDGESIVKPTLNLLAILNAAHGTDSGSRGTATGGLMATKFATPAAIATGEGTPAGEGAVSRMVRIELGKTDVARTPTGASPYDTFLTRFTGFANQLHGAYIQWLAHHLDEVGLPAFTRENDDLKRAWMSTNSTRTSETVATLAVGWIRLLEFAEEFGVSDKFPAMDEIKVWLARLVTSNTDGLAAFNPAFQVINEVRDRIASGRAYVDTPDGRVPKSEQLARALGWQQRTFGSENGPIVEYVPGIFRAGVLSNDGLQVCITGAAIQDVKRALDMRGIPADQLTRAAKHLVVEGSAPGNKTSEASFTSRPRGWVVSIEQLDLDLSAPVEKAKEPAQLPPQPAPAPAAKPEPKPAPIAVWANSPDSDMPFS